MGIIDVRSSICFVIYYIDECPKHLNVFTNFLPFPPHLNKLVGGAASYVATFIGSPQLYSCASNWKFVIDIIFFPFLSNLILVLFLHLYFFISYPPAQTQQTTLSEGRVPDLYSKLVPCPSWPGLLDILIWISLVLLSLYSNLVVVHQQQFCPSYISNIGSFRFISSKGRSARKADNLTAICEPIV
jgi:hypothetical protein